MSNKICTISVYYGRFNNYFPLWLKTCKYNPDVDFLIVTDIIYNNDIPKNVIFIRMTLEELRARISRVVGFEVSIPQPYKICDYRPTFGEVFGDYLTTYDYWGHNDLDMLNGDIMSFLRKYNFEKYEKFLPLGHLAFYKNTKDVNNYYKLPGSKCGDYKTVFKISNRTLAFDENIGINSIFLANKKTLFYKRIFADIGDSYYRMIISAGAGIDNVYEKNYKRQIFYWDRGHLYRDYVDKGVIKTQEFIYIHLFHRPNFTPSFDVKITDSFYITPSGFVPKLGNTTVELIEKLNPYKSLLYERYEYVRWALGKIKEKLKIKIWG